MSPYFKNLAKKMDVSIEELLKEVERYYGYYANINNKSELNLGPRNNCCGRINSGDNDPYYSNRKFSGTYVFLFDKEPDINKVVLSTRFTQPLDIVDIFTINDKHYSPKVMVLQ